MAQRQPHLITRPEFGFCRAVAHTFVRTQEAITFDANGDMNVRLRCLHCGSHKRLIFDPNTGVLVKAPIDYVDGYLLKGIVKQQGSAPSKNEFRREFASVLIREGGGRRRLRAVQNAERRSA